MKRYNIRNSIVLLSLWVFSATSVYSQVGINTEQPDSSAVLELKDAGRGLLIPRLTPGLRRNIVNNYTRPANSLLTFDTRHKYFYFLDTTDRTTDNPKGTWKALNPWILNGSYDTDNNNNIFYNGGGNVGIGTSAPASKLVIGGNISVGTAYRTIAAPANGMIIQGSVGIGTNTPEAKVHINSTGAMIIPTGTTDQRPTLTTSGGVRYNTSTQNLEVHNGDMWKSIGVPAGTIFPFAGDASKVPDGWLLCNGAAINRNDYPDLYTVIGTAWGAGNGSTTFNIPDLRGRFIRGVDNGSNRDPDRNTRTQNAPGGNTGNAIGTIQDDQIRSHSHDVTDPGHSHNFNDLHQGGEDSDNADDRTVGSDWTTTSPNTTDPSSTGITINAAGGNETRPVNAYVNYIIKY